MTAKVNKNNSARKKLIPAIAMLTVSAMTLASSTYAWFTMSREVEVKNIQMTATVPEDIQISLGCLASAANTKETSANGVSLAQSTGILYAASGSTADNGAASAPEQDWDWSNTADISAYYQIGKLIPASSTTGENIFFTADADGVGKTVKSNAVYYKANGATPGGTAVAENTLISGQGGAKTLQATLHAVNNITHASDTWSAGGTGNYQQSTAWNTTQDDGYYVDIPVWFRTSSTAGANLKVEAYVIPNDTNIRENTAGEALYRAIRVAVLDPGNNPTGSSVTASNLLPVMNGWENMSTSAYGNIKTTPFDKTTNVNNWYGGAKTADVAVDAAGTLNGSRFDSAIYSAATEYDGSAAVVTLAAGQGTSYSDPVKAVIRVWLEGEDPDCWNDTAGQNWSINLKFLNGTTSDGKDINTASTSTQTPVTPDPQQP